MSKLNICAIAMGIFLALINPTLSYAQEPEANTTPSIQRTPEIIYWYRNYDTQATHRLLQLALDKTADLYGKTTIKRSPKITQGRAIADLQQSKHGTVTLINVIPDLEREKNLIPVYLPTDDGLIGLRVCIINANDQERFNNIRSHQDISDHNIVFGQSEHWPDTKILRANGLTVITNSVYENLFTMLKNKRFNCFLRGVSEVYSDLENQGDDTLSVESTLLFSYPSASLFFVNKNNQQLATRLELGLRRATLDGSYQTHYRAMYSKNLEKLKLSQRRIFRLNNPLISDQGLKKVAEKLNFNDGKLDIY